MDHIPELESDASVGPHMRDVIEFLSSASPIDSASAKRAYGVLRTNAFGFSTERGGEGAALFARVSLLSHSCKPNLQHVQVGQTN